ncbi:adenylate cyclase type 8-like [Arctopsyche grandis]|uniref:adenylate cyclase type 8-like n=1 Tax=Arctopsyche grandis TaxID=121162 RepID=UPI00406D79F8
MNYLPEVDPVGSRSLRHLHHQHHRKGIGPDECTGSDCNIDDSYVDDTKDEECFEDRKEMDLGDDKAAAEEQCSIEGDGLAERFPGDGASSSVAYSAEDPQIDSFTLDICDNKENMGNNLKENSNDKDNKGRSSKSPTKSNNGDDDPKSYGLPAENSDVFKRGMLYKGIYWPSLTNSFQDTHLELSYLKYSHRQRQKSLIIVNIVDFGLKCILATAWGLITNQLSPKPDSVAWTACGAAGNIALCILSCWRCFANNYLHWAAVCTWLLLNAQGFVGNGLGFTTSSYRVWYVLFIVFVPYAMLPLPLRWCLLAGAVSALSHVLVTVVDKLGMDCVSMNLAYINLTCKPLSSCQLVYIA